MFTSNTIYTIIIFTIWTCTCWWIRYSVWFTLYTIIKSLYTRM